jgi:hypothetical protein
MLLKGGGGGGGRPRHNVPPDGCHFIEGAVLKQLEKKTEYAGLGTKL